MKHQALANEVLVQGETSLRGSVNVTINATTPSTGRFGGPVVATKNEPEGFPLMCGCHVSIFSVNPHSGSWVLSGFGFVWECVFFSNAELFSSKSFPVKSCEHIQLIPTLYIISSLYSESYDIQILDPFIIQCAK